MKGQSALQLLLAAVAAPAAVATWTNVRTGGGGGFIPGIVFHPKTKGVAYARADIGGLYRLNSDDSWTPLTDSLATDAKWHDWGIDAMAVDPQDASKVYAAVGMYTNSWDPSDGSIIRSSDQGNTWSSSDLPFKVGGNMPGRGMGERLAVDPANSDILYFGARSGNGLWKSTDGGVTWAKVSTFTNVGTYRPDPTDTTGLNSDLMGLTFVTFDSTSGTTNGATSRIFVGTADNITASVYVSSDAGATWSAVEGQPGKYFPHKCKLQPTEKALYLTYADGTGPYDGTDGAVYRYDLTNSTWKDITPVSGSNLYFGFGGLGVDMQKPGTLVVASLNSWWPDAQLFRSNDSGTTWSPIWAWTSYPDQNWYYGLYTNNAPWINAGFISQDTKRLGWMIEALEIDPFDSDHWLYGTGLTLYGGHDLTKWDTIHNITISSLAVGIEEMAVLGLASPPNGTELLAGVGDDCGFTYKSTSDLGTAPQTPWMTPIWTSTTDVDYAGNEPSNIVRVGSASGSQQIALSTDGGVTWNIDYATDDTKEGGTLAFSANADTIVWSSGNSGVLRSQNQGTFTAISAVPSGAAVASDKRNNTVFYAGSGANFYRSTDTGATFTETASAFGSAVSSVVDIAAHPTVAGEVWVSTNAGLFRSTDYGVTFAAVGASSLSNTQSIGFGKGSGSTGWNLYAFGTGSDGNKLYGSSDSGASWVDVQGSQGFGAISSNKVVGSGNVANQVYVGTNGRGVFYAQVSVPAGGGSSSSSSSSSAAHSTSSSSSKSSSAPSTLTTSTVKSTSSSSSVKTTSSSSVKITSSSSATSTVKSTSTSTSTAAAGTASHWGQCGGSGYVGPTVCASPYTCQEQNAWYSQCL